MSGNIDILGGVSLGLSMASLGDELRFIHWLLFLLSAGTGRRAIEELTLLDRQALA